MPDSSRVVVGGVDTHRDVHAAAAVDGLGRVLGTALFAASGAGYRGLWEWLGGFGRVVRVGVEGTGSWGAGLARFLDGRVGVVEVARPSRQHRRRWGKSDVTDAVAAARAVLSGEASGVPRGGGGPVEALRLLRVARMSARKQATAVANQIHSVVATAPEGLRARLRGLSLVRIVGIAVAYRPGEVSDPTQAAKLTLRTLARRWKNLKTEIGDLDGHIESVVRAAAPPGLLDEVGVGPLVAADLLIAAGDHPGRLASRESFAALCGVSPVDASSGLQQRHRLNRGGDRLANAALHRAVVVRLRYHPETRHYLARRVSEGKTKREAMRILKHYLARRIHHILTRPRPTPA